MTDIETPSARPAMVAEFEAGALTADALTAELCALTRNWNDHEDIPKSQQQECRQIGVKLFDAGGHRAMVDAYYEAKAKNRFVSVIQAYWDGVGEWRW